MKRRKFLLASGVAVAGARLCSGEMVPRQIPVTLPEAHRGTLEIDTNLLDSFGAPPQNQRQFYLDARKVFTSSRVTNFSDDAIVQLASQHSIDLMGGPMLGNLTSDGVTVWMRPATAEPLTISVGQKRFSVQNAVPGQETRTVLSGLTADTEFTYSVLKGQRSIAEGSFRTAPPANQMGTFRLTFGSCFHKIGLHNPNLFREILGREPSVMMMLGDLAVDDRNGNISMHRCDYQLRDVAPAWQQFVRNMPIYTAWDDHDYFDNDLNGIPTGFTAQDRDGLRAVWKQNWNNPTTDPARKGIYFNTRVGPVEIIMLDTRSCRENSRRREFGSYLGKEQFDWLLSTLSESTAPFKVISSGTMWSDYISKAKDSWGTWDTEARERIFRHIEQNNIPGVLLVSGDRHGARAFRIPRENGFAFHEFEPATLGGVSGPAALVDNCPEQIFGYGRDNLVAFGEFTFDSTKDNSGVTFRLIKETGQVLEEHHLSYEQLTPRMPA